MSLMEDRQDVVRAEAEQSAARAVLHIDLDALARNYRRLSRLAHCEISAVVKRDAYGLGLEAVSAALAAAGCRAFWVAGVEEGERLRACLPSGSRIFVMDGLFGQAPERFLHAGLTPVIDQPEELELCARAAQQNAAPFPLALNVDTGLSRAGMDEASLRQLAQNSALLENVSLALVMTMLSDFEQPANPVNARQLTHLKALAALLPAAPLSAATSSFVYHDAGWHLDLARAGSALYGVRSAALTDYHCEPVISVEAPVLAVRELEAGSAIGYGGRRLERSKRAATLGLGYADGLPERFTQTCQAYVAGRALDFLGSDSMTLSTLDISTLPPGRLRRGQAVEIVGPHQDVNAVGHALDINPNRVLSSFGARAARRYHPAVPQGDGGAEWISG